MKQGNSFLVSHWSCNIYILFIYLLRLSPAHFLTLYLFISNQLLYSPWSGNKVAPQTYTALLSGCAVAEPCRWELALQLLRGMEAADGVRPNAVHYNACLTALAHATGRNTEDEEQQGGGGDSGDRFEDAMEVLSEMREAGVAPDTYTFRALLTARGRSGRWAVKRCLESGGGSGIGGAAAAAAVGSAEAALELVDAMPAVGVKPNAYVYEAALEACCGAFDELRDEAAAAAAADGAAAAAAVDPVAMETLSRRVAQLIEAMRGDGYAPSDDTSTALRKHFVFP